MKLKKIYAVALAALTLSACSDDDNDANTAACVVNMQEQTMTASEDIAQDTYYNVPIVVTGNANGPIRVTVEVSGSSGTPAVEGEHYVITEKTITIPADKKTGYIEFHTTGDKEINDDRQFVMTIVDAEGATIGTNKTTVVNLLDDDHLLPEAYAKINGIYSCVSDDGTFDLGISTYPEGDENYLKKAVIYGWQGYNWAQMECTFSYDVASGSVRLNIPVGSLVAEGVEFNGIGVANIFVCGYSSDGLSLGGSISVVSNPEVTEFEFQSGLAGGIFKGDGKKDEAGNPVCDAGDFLGYIWFGYQSLKMNKMQ